MSLDAFAAKHTSEDNASFEEALERARNAHVRKYWWCYDAERLKAAGFEVADTSSLNTHLLSDGTRISDERRLKADAAAADEPMASDNSQRLLDFAPHEPRNALLFPPAYEAVNAKPVVKAIQRANTRFKEEPRARDGNSSPSHFRRPGASRAGPSVRWLRRHGEEPASPRHRAVGASMAWAGDSNAP